MQKSIELLEELLKKEAFPWTKEMGERFQIYEDTLLEWNQKMNLTAITDPAEIAVKHFYDSLVLLRYVKIPEHAKVIDVGTGAGFPGIPLLIARPDLRLTLLDSTKKRLTFLDEVLKKIGLKAETLHARGEEAGQLPAYREQFDFATARAVAAMPVLAEYCLPFVKTEGFFLAMKGPDFEEECRNAAHAIGELGGKIAEIHKFSLPDQSARTMVILKKMSQTSPKYPRPSAKIAKKPL